MRCSTILFLTSLAACGPADSTKNTEPKVVRTWLSPATAGGKGGNGGLISLLPSVLIPTGVDVKNAFLITEGSGGLGGKSAIGSAGPDAPQGVAGEFALDLHPFTFDATGITPEMITDVNGANLMLYLKDNADPLAAMELDTLRVATGSHLELGCDVRIRARQVFIERGGSLVVRGRDSGTCTIGVGLQLENRPGLSGGQVLIEADTFKLDGTLDIAGNPGARGEAGGNGGSLEVRASIFSLGDEARVLANGGRGGDGFDEHELP